MDIGDATYHKIYCSIDNINDVVYDGVWGGQLDNNLLDAMWEIFFPSVFNSTTLRLNW